MKRFGRLFLMIFLGTMVSCAQQTPQDDEEGKAGIQNSGYWVADPTDACLQIRCVTHAGNTPFFYDVTVQTYANPNNEELKELADKLTAQCIEAGADPQNLSGSVLYASMEGLSLTADKAISERKSGEELIDLFDLAILGDYTFTFPEGNLTEPIGRYLFDAKEWVTLGYMCPLYFSLIPKEGVSIEELGGATITVKITIGEGQTIVGSCAGN